MGPWVLAALVLLAAPRLALAEDAPAVLRHHVVLDGKVLKGVTFEQEAGETWFPLHEMALAAGLKLTLEADGTVRVGGRSFKATTRAVGGRVLVTRADVKRALNATVFIDPEGPRAVITTAGARLRLAQQAGRPVEATPRPASSPRPGPSHVSPPGHAGPNPPQADPARRAAKLGIFSVELDRAAHQRNMMRVSALVRNEGAQALRNVTVTFVLWDEGEGQVAPDEITGDLVARGKLYSEYPLALGDLAPGESKRFEVVTSVANPDKIDTSSRLVELNLQSAVDSFAVRRLRYGFRARIDTP